MSGIVDSQWQSMCRAIPYGEYAEIVWRRDAHQELGARLSICASLTGRQAPLLPRTATSTCRALPA